MNIKNQCNCKLCKLSRLRTEALMSDDIEFIKKALKTFSDEWLMTDFEHSYLQCIMNGSWPGANEMLQEALNKTTNNEEKTRRP